MIDLPDGYDLGACERFLRGLGASDTSLLPIAEAALALASFERPRVALGRYIRHLGTIAHDVGRHAGAAGGTEQRLRALNEIILLKYGYSGDELTYDDTQNANLMRVVDRRKGLPVALGILYLHAARAQGWDAVGLAFPGHFLIRVTDGPERMIVDPFHGGTVCDAARLRDLLKATAGQDIDLAPDHYAPVADRDILLRLQNNLKSRHAQAGRYEPALRIVDTMLMLAPDLVDLWRESGILHARIGNMRAAMDALGEFVARAPDGTERHHVAAMLQQLKTKLN
jgi:regulator of sirC expression with transglutaminase-like and TPR domain